MASERERADVRERRREWIEKRQPRMRLQPARLVFIDETAVNTKMTRLRGRSRRGQRLRASAPFGRFLPPCAQMRRVNTRFQSSASTLTPPRTSRLLPEIRPDVIVE